MKTLRLQIGDFAQPAGLQPFSRCNIGCLGVHIDQPVAFADGNQIVLSFPVGIVAFLAPDFRAGLEQFPAAASVFDVDNLFFTANLHMSDKPVGPG